MHNLSYISYGNGPCLSKPRDKFCPREKAYVWGHTRPLLGILLKFRGHFDLFKSRQYCSSSWINVSVKFSLHIFRSNPLVFSGLSAWPCTLSPPADRLWHFVGGRHATMTYPISDIVWMVQFIYIIRISLSSSYIFSRGVGGISFCISHSFLLKVKV